MVDNKAIVKVISRITKNNGAPCKKALQKIVFLIEAKHVDYNGSRDPDHS